MSNERYRFQFHDVIPPEDVEATLIISIVAVEALHGETQTRLDAAHAFDAGRRSLVIDAHTPVGRDLNRIFVGFLVREFGPASFQVARVTPPQSAPTAAA